jgi:CDP-diacylglycerol--glycerol-3-phosphate 3-phosphatidyltransferase
MIKHLPNAITIFRFALIPVISTMMLSSKSQNSFIGLSIPCVLFIIAAISDFLDGFLARKLNAESKFGIFFDNIADKLLNISLICILIKNGGIWLVPAIIAISREILISSLREYMALNLSVKVPVDIYGKIKTAMQFIALAIIIQACFSGSQMQNLIGNAVFTISVIISVISAVLYTSVFFKK